MIRAIVLVAVGVVVGIVVMARNAPPTPAGSVLPTNYDVRVSISDVYLSRHVRARVSSSRIVSLSHVQVRSASPVLVVDARAGIGPLSAPVSMALQPFPSGGQVQVRIISTHVGIVPIPNFLTSWVAASIDDSLAHTVGTTVAVTGVTVTPSGLDITANFP